MFKKWLTRTTPFVVIALFSAIVLLYQFITQGGGPDGWRYPFLLRLLFFILFIIAVDLILKYAIATKTFWIWVVEIFLCLGLLYYWIVT